MAVGQHPAMEKMGIVKGERVEIFQRSVLKNTTRTLMIPKRLSSQLAEVARGCFGVCPFSKRGKVLIFWA
jgi:hypothetical protein